MNILSSIKNFLGINDSVTHFDSALLMHINGSFVSLTQIGAIEDSSTLSIDENTNWDDIFSNQELLNAVKPYIYLSVRLAFDPPQTSFVIESIERQLEELTWRISSLTEGDFEI